MTGTDFVSSAEQERLMEFSRSVIPGVEIKLCRNSPHSYKPHVHNELSLGYIVEGSTELTLNDRTVRFKTGDGVIIPPLMTHRCAPEDISRWSYVMLFIDPAYYGDKVRFGRAKKLAVSQTPKLISFIEQLLTEKNQNTSENILIDLLIEFGDKGIKVKSNENESAVTKGIHDYILSHVKDDISLDMLQNISGLNKFTIIRNFKKRYVTTPASFHLQYRVAEAKKLLSSGADIFDICEELRFYDQAHLIREFKKMYGITPGMYTEQLKG